MVQVQRSLRFAMLVSAVGGFLDAYSFLHADVFAGAQTGNFVIASIHLADREWVGALRAVVPILAYAAGSGLGAGFRHRRFRRGVPHPARTALGVEIIAIGLAALPPLAGSDLWLTILLAMAAGIQMAVFTRVHHWSFSTTVMTNNIAKWMAAIVAAIGSRDATAWREVAAFTGIVLAFAAGAVVTGLLVPSLGTLTIVVPVCVLLVGLAWLVTSDGEAGT